MKETVKKGYGSGLKIFLASLALALLLSGCGAFSRDALIATWKLPANGMTMQFMETGQLRFLLPVAAKAPPLDASYQFINDSTLVFTPDQALNFLLTDQTQNLNLTTRNPVTYTVQGNTLTLVINGQEFSLQSVK